MNLIRLPSHAIYRTKDIVKLLANSSLPSLSEERCSEYLWLHHGIRREQIKGSFLEIRIRANNLRAARFWRLRAIPSVHVSTMPEAEVLPYRVPVAEHGGPALEVRA